MPEIVFPLSSSPGRGNQESGGRLINAFTEKLGDSARAKTVRRRAPGLTTLTTVPDRIHCRGFMWSGNVLYMALNQRLVKVVKSGSSYNVTDLGELAGTLPVTFARNNRAITPDIVVVTENGAFNVLSDSAPTDFADNDLPSPNSVCQLGGYLIFTTLFGEIWASDLNSVSVNGDSYTTALSKSDALFRGISFRNELFAFGQSSIDVYADAGTSPFPLEYRTSVPRGLKGPWAVAGQQDGWSNELLWVGDDNKVYQLDGYRAIPVSTHDVEQDIESVTDSNEIEAGVYMSRGHAIFSISSDSWTWEFNLTTRLWHERESYLKNRWRASQTIHAFDAWVAGDNETGALYAISADANKEGTSPLIFTVESAPSSAFPGRVAIPRVDFDMEVGVGVVGGAQPIETDPQARISWSDDGGATWSSPLMRSLGKQAKTNTTVTVTRTGMAGPKGRMWRVDVSDPVRVGLYGGTFAAEGRV